LEINFLRKNNWRALLGTGLIALSLVAASCTTTSSTATSAVATKTTTTGQTTAVTTTKATTTGITTTNASTTTSTTAAALTVTNGSNTTTYTLTQLKTLKPTTGYGTTKNKAGVLTGPNTCVGVELTALIKATGGLANGGAVRITAQDGYTKLLSYAQIYQGTFNVYDKIGASTIAGLQPFISLVYSINGADLDAATGPVEMGIMTASDQASDSSMWIKLVNKIEILQPVTLNVSAAASLSTVLKAINTAYSQINPNVNFSANFASSGTLQTQIENGAPADVFISAALTQMDNLQKEGLIIPSTRKNLLNNSLVLIVPVNSKSGITSFNDLTLSKVTKIAIGDPKSVPAGTYAQKTFDLLGITVQIQSKLILGADVTQVLTYVASANVDAGLVYSTDALSNAQVKVAAQAPATINSQIVYPAAIITGTKNQAAAQSYLNFLFSDAAKTIFQQYGFSMASN
jgi:molybdate transport system substrate-binding protein